MGQIVNFLDVDDCEVPLDSPLHADKFFTQRTWGTTQAKRQKFVLSVAAAWRDLYLQHSTMKRHCATEVQIILSKLPIRDGRGIIEKFFNIVSTGYKVSKQSHKLTIAHPKRISKELLQACLALGETKWQPEPEPTDGEYVKSHVMIEEFDMDEMREWLLAEKMSNYIPMVRWLATQKDVTIYYEPAGELKQRDKSIWPIKNLETWPSALRSKVVAGGVDIDSAYYQFMVTKLLSLECIDVEGKFPDLYKLVHKKNELRAEICELAGVDTSAQSIAIVKRLFMALANGPAISEKMIVTAGRQTEAVQCVFQLNPNISNEGIARLAAKLVAIKQQFTHAGRIVALAEGHDKATQKDVYHLYLKWERNARYKIWKVLGCQGLMMHDGIDGIQTTLHGADLTHFIEEATNIKVTCEW